jgi:hypothetical protein
MRPGRAVAPRSKHPFSGQIGRTGKNLSNFHTKMHAIGHGQIGRFKA